MGARVDIQSAVRIVGISYLYTPGTVIRSAPDAVAAGNDSWPLRWRDGRMDDMPHTSHRCAIYGIVTARRAYDVRVQTVCDRVQTWGPRSICSIEACTRVEIPCLGLCASLYQSSAQTNE